MAVPAVGRPSYYSTIVLLPAAYKKRVLDHVKTHAEGILALVFGEFEELAQAVAVDDNVDVVEKCVGVHDGEGLKYGLERILWDVGRFPGCVSGG